jgi:dTDP-4-amino-4,6-dideoxygalactose transaminase
MNEVQAAFGLLNLGIVGAEIAKRKRIAATYRKQLRNVKGLHCLQDIPGVVHNYSYFPVLIDPEVFGADRNIVYRGLQEYNVFARKYFHPICSHFVPYRTLPSASPKKLPVAERVGSQVLCLPIHGGLRLNQIKKITAIIKHIQKEQPKVSL